MSTVAFDLDGTLISVKERDYKIYSDVLTELGYRPIEEGYYWSLRCCKYNIIQLLRLSGLSSSQQIDNFLSQREERMEQPKYLALDTLQLNVFSVIEDLTKHYRCVIVTIRHNQANTKKQLEDLGLNKLFDGVFIAKENKKDTFKRIGDLAAIVGDTENDIFPAKEMGVKCIGVTTGIRNKSLLQLMQPNAIIDNLVELKELL